MSELLIRVHIPNVKKKKILKNHDYKSTSSSRMFLQVARVSTRSSITLVI